MTLALAVLSSHDLASWGDRKLENAIQHGHAAAGAHMHGYEEAATLTGVLLLERKRRLKHGEWLSWLAEHFEGSKRTAQDYMKLAEQWLANAQPPAYFDSPAEDIEPIAASGDELDADSEVVDGEIDGDVTTTSPAPSRANRNGATATTHGSQLVDWLPDMLPGASPEGAFRQEVLAWCSQERSIDGMLDSTGILLMPKSDDDLDALLDALDAIHQTATRLERQLKR